MQPMQIDPTCGAELSEEDVATTVVYNGDTKCFCSPACKQRFIEEPDAYS